MSLTIRAAGAVMAFGVATSLHAGMFQTTNFEVIADTLSLAQQIAEEAENSRDRLARHWLDRPLEDWPFRCRIQVISEKTGGSGWTSYQFLGQGAIRVGIRLKGPPERLMEYVLPHELTHAILVTALGEALPRWADEGAAMLSESQSQQLRQRLVVEQLVQRGNSIPFRQLLRMKDYPASKHNLHAFYAISLTLSEFLIAHGGRARFLQFVRDGHSGDWDAAIHQHYEWEDAEALQMAWSDWVLKNAEIRNAKRSQQIIIASE